MSSIPRQVLSSNQANEDEADDACVTHGDCMCIQRFGNCWKETTRKTHEQMVGKVKVKQSHYRSEVPRMFQEVKVPRLCDNGPGWW